MPCYGFVALHGKYPCRIIITMSASFHVEVEFHFTVGFHIGINICYRQSMFTLTVVIYIEAVVLSTDISDGLGPSLLKAAAVLELGCQYATTY